MSMFHRIILGPQRLRPMLADVVKECGLSGQTALITAGWQEREEEDQELVEALGLPATNLQLHARWETVSSEDPEFFQAHRKRQDRMWRLQKLYLLRLDKSLDAARELLAIEDEVPEMLDPAVEDAIETVRSIDEHHVERVRELHQEFEETWKPLQREAIQRQREDILKLLADCPNVAIAGGHVAVLLNRMRLFGLKDMIDKHHIIAWSAGAMALSEHVVLFHDSPPQGRSNPEILDVGLGLLRGILPLPHAKRRLKLKERDRVGILARRFKEFLCVALDEGDRVDLIEEGHWRPRWSARVLREDGTLKQAEA